MVITQITAPLGAAVAPPARLPVGAETAVAVAGAPPGPEADNDPARREHAAAALPPALDPNAPVGPPPAFSANVLEAERARLRDGQQEDTPRRPGLAEAGAAYGVRPAPAPGVLDLAR